MATQHSSPKVSSEDILSQKTDLCISNAIVKTGLGFSAGVVLSVLLFKRRAFPVWLGTGFGLGSGYTDCDRSFNPVAVPGVRVVPAGATEIGTGPATTFEKLQQKAGEAFGSAREKVSSSLEKAEDKAGELASKAEDKASDAASKAQSDASGLLDKVQDKASEITSAIQEKGKEAFEKAKAAEQKVEDKIFRIRSVVEDSNGTGTLPGDCMACRLTGFATLSFLGGYSLLEAHRLGTFVRSRPRRQPFWGATLVLFGVSCFGAAVVRLGL